MTKAPAVYRQRGLSSIEHCLTKSGPKYAYASMRVSISSSRESNRSKAAWMG